MLRPILCNKPIRPGRSITIGAALLMALLLAAFLGFLAGGQRQVEYEMLNVTPSGSFQTQYLLDFDYRLDEATLHATMGHLLLFNPRSTPTYARITFYFEQRDPAYFNLTIPARTSRESNFKQWPVKPGERFAVEIRSDAPLIAQSTRGWTNTANDYSPRAVTHSPRGRRETARSSMAIAALANRWFIADAIVLNLPEQLWIRESEWALLLNPSNESTGVRLQLYFDGKIQIREVQVEARRLRAVFMDPLVDDNRHYGVEIISERAIAAQWVRQVRWNDSTEEMSSWSVPAVPMNKPDQQQSP